MTNPREEQRQFLEDSQYRRIVLYTVQTAILAILYENIQAFFDGQGGVEDDQTETQRKNIVARSDFEEIADCALSDRESVKRTT